MITIRDFLSHLTSLESYTIFAIVADIAAVFSIPFILVQRRGRPVGALAWILSVFAVPVLGFLLWWTIGFNHLGRKRKWRKRSANELRGYLHQLRSKLDAPAGNTDSISQVLTASDYGVFPPTVGNRAKLLVDGERSFPEMLQAIDSANHHVHFLFYIWQRDQWGHRFRDALARAAKRGVTVRALYDGFGSSAIDRHFLAPIREAGGHVLPFLPHGLFVARWALNFRNHRKILVVDERRAFIGGTNIGDDYARDGWRDFMVAVTGPVIDQIQEVFADDWYFASAGESIADSEHFGCCEQVDGDAECNVVASGPDTDRQETLDALFIALNRSQKRVELMTPYFVPERTLLTTLRTLCMRGIDVSLILPGVIDHSIVQWVSRSYYHELLEAGVKIYEYRRSMLHGKAIVIDDDLAFVGSANLDQRSFRLNFEASVFVRDTAFNQALRDAFALTRCESEAVSPEDYPDARGLTAVKHAILQLTSPLL